MCGYRSSYAVGPAGIYDAGKALAAEALEDATGGFTAFTDEDFTQTAVEPTEHFDLNVRQMQALAAGLAVVTRLFMSPGKLKLALGLQLIDTDDLIVFVAPGDDLSGAAVPSWPPTEGDLKRAIDIASELGIQLMQAVGTLAG